MGFVRGLTENHWDEYLPSNVVENLLTMRGVVLHLSAGPLLTDFLKKGQRGECGVQPRLDRNKSNCSFM